MARRSTARWMAPLALLGALAAVLIVLQSSGGESNGGDDSPTTTASSSGTTSTETTTTTSKGPKYYTVQPGDVLSTIADETGVPLEQIEELNSDVDAQALVAGQRIRLRP